MSGEKHYPTDVDRRREDRRDGFVRLADYTLPELRKAVLSIGLLLAILGLFIYMVHKVIVAVIAGIVLAAYLIPLQLWLERRLKSSTLTAILVIILVIVPLGAIVTYSWVEISDTAEYLNQNRQAVADEITAALQRLPYGQDLEVREDMARWVSGVANRSRAIVEELQETLDIVVLSAAVFLFTLFYILTDHERIVEYIRGKVPGRYLPLATNITSSIRYVTYGALYATFLTQFLKALIVLAMNLIWDVPLAAVLALASFFIGFLPIVGSWSIYVPTAVYIMVFRDNVIGGVLMILIGLLGNTLFISMYLRPRIAASKSRVLNFYWMFIALVTGVYTFGLIGIIIGPVLIGVLKAAFESVTGGTIDFPEESEADAAPV
ncbi:MAG: AI-2E family transporter [Gemmatimonadota bacterium]